MPAEDAAAFRALVGRLEGREREGMVEARPSLECFHSMEGFVSKTLRTGVQLLGRARKCQAKKPIKAAKGDKRVSAPKAGATP